MRKKGENEGELIVVDGLDGIGKGVIERALIEYEQKLGRAVFDTIAHSRGWDSLPELKDFWRPPVPHFNTIVTAEPTYAGIGKTIREEIIAQNQRDYSIESQIRTYADDRLVQMTRFANPARINGVRDLRSRCVAASLTYQVLGAQNRGMSLEEARNLVLSQEGNQLALEWAPNLLIIPTIESAEEVIKRIQERKKNQKDDHSIFDNLKFQERLKDHYEDAWLKELFEGNGTTVAYINAGISIQSTGEQAREIYSSFLETRIIPEKFSTPYKALEED